MSWMEPRSWSVFMAGPFTVTYPAATASKLGGITVEARHTGFFRVGFIGIVIQGVISTTLEVKQVAPGVKRRVLGVEALFYQAVGPTRAGCRSGIGVGEILSV